MNLETINSDFQEPLCKTQIENFVLFMGFMAREGLLDGLAPYLRTRGLGELYISLDSIKVAQRYIQESLAARPGGVTRDALPFIKCSHGQHAVAVPVNQAEPLVADIG